jgi:hypothetical protein
MNTFEYMTPRTILSVSVSFSLSFFLSFSLSLSLSPPPSLSLSLSIRVCVCVYNTYTHRWGKRHQGDTKAHGTPRTTRSPHSPPLRHILKSQHTVTLYSTCTRALTFENLTRDPTNTWLAAPLRLRVVTTMRFACVRVDVHTHTHTHTHMSKCRMYGAANVLFPNPKP